MNSSPKKPTALPALTLQARPAGKGATKGAGSSAGQAAGQAAGQSASKDAGTAAGQAAGTPAGRVVPALDVADPLYPLWQLDGVAEAALAAADAISAVHRHRANLRKHNVTGSESVLRGARASAWLAGGERTLPEDGHVTDPTLAAALRLADTISPEKIEDTARIWKRAPLQILAKFALHASPTASNANASVDSSNATASADASVDSESSDSVTALANAGRPVGDAQLSAAMKEQRLHVLADMLTGGTAVHAGVLSAIVHGELLTLAPFAHHNGLIARAAARLTTVATGFDPRGLGVPEVYWTRHKDAYDKAAAGFKSGTPEGLREFILLHLAGLQAGAVEARGIADAV